MDRSRLSPLARTCASLAAVALIACAPPAGECQGYDECPAGQFCQAGTCVSDGLTDDGPIVRRDAGTPPPRDAGPRPDGGGATDEEAQVRTTFDVPWIQWDPQVSGRILVAEQQESGGVITIDRVLALDTSELRLSTAPVYDLSTLPSGACRLDSIVFGAAPDETWFNCDLAPGLRIVFDDNVASPGNTESESAHVVHVVPGAGTDDARALVAARGGALRAWQLQPSDGLNQPRESDAVSGGVNGVIAIFRLDPRNVPGTHVLVHDADTSRLVPLSRTPGNEQWDATQGLQPLELPAATHIALVIGSIAANGSAIAPNEPNLMTIEPSTGLARYWVYETAQPILPDTTFEPESLHRGEKPAPSQRLLLAPSPSGDFVFYARPDGDKIYRIPLSPGGDTLVRQRLLDDTSRELSSLLAIDDDTVWVSYANENLVERLKVDQRR